LHPTTVGGRIVAIGLSGVEREVAREDGVGPLGGVVEYDARGSHLVNP
jgi:hypothetical protein